MTATEKLLLVGSKVTGVAPIDRNFFGGMIQRRLELSEHIDFRISWSDGDSSTDNPTVAVECDSPLFDRIRDGIEHALADTYLKSPEVVQKQLAVVA